MNRSCGFVWLCAGVLVFAGAGCATTPRAPSDGILREKATQQVCAAVRMPERPDVRAQAMEAAAEVLIDQASLFLREGLQDTHPAVRFAACMGLGELAEADAEPAIKPLVHDPDGSVRVAAYFALERLGDLSHRVAWRDALLNNPEPEVRRNAALALGRLHDKHVIPLLRKAFSDDPDDGVRLQALEALAFLGDKYAINRFLLDAYGGVGFKQPFALLTLGRVPGDRVVSALRTRLQYAPYLEARLAAARSLGMQGYDEGYQLALESLDWNEPDAQEKKGSPEVQIMRVRSMAALALGDIGRRDALGALHQTMETETDPRVRLAAATAILNILNDSLAPSRIS